MKHINYSIILALLPLIFVSCGKSDDPEPTPEPNEIISIVGHWALIHSEGFAYDQNGYHTDWNYNVNKTSLFYSEIIFKEDGTIIQYDTDHQTGQLKESVRTIYTAQDGHLTFPNMIHYDVYGLPTDDYEELYELSGNQLTWTSRITDYFKSISVYEIIKEP